MPNTTIDDFESSPSTETDERTETRVERSPSELTADDVNVDEASLPGEYAWSDRVSIHHDVAAMVSLDEDKSFSVETSSVEHSLGKNQVAYVITGSDALKVVSDASERVYPPSTYGEFNEFDAYYARATSTFSSSLYGGWGIPADRFEAAIRFVTGGGRYNAANLTVTALDFRVGWLIEYKGDTYLFSYAKVEPPEHTVETYTVNGITIENEGNPGVLNGVEHIMELLPELGITITGFDEIHNSSLRFNTEEGKPIALNGSQVHRATRPVTDLSELEGTHEIELFHQDATYEYTWEEGATKYEPGEVLERDGHSSKRLVLGYTKHRKQIQRGVRPDKYTVGTRVLAKPWFLKISPGKSESFISTRLYGQNGSEIIAEVPYDLPDHPNPEGLDEIKSWTPDNTGLNL